MTRLMPALGRDPRSRDDQGSALIITLMVMTLVLVLATTVSVLTIGNLRTSWGAQQAGSALNAADAGVSQAMSYLRSSGVTGLTCPAPCGDRPDPATTPTLGDADLPSTTGQSYDVWIQSLTAFVGDNEGRYRIWSRGRAAGEAERWVAVDVGVTANDVPRGIYADTINGGGSASVTHESVFSTGCVYDRSKIDMDDAGIDAAYGIPAGVHSSKVVTTSKTSCSDSNSIHKGGGPEPQCNTSFPFDHDKMGAPFTSSTCRNKFDSALLSEGISDSSAFDRYYADGSRISDEQQLFDLFDFDPKLPQSLIDSLKTMAASQGNLEDDASDWDVPDETNAVMYFKLTGDDVTINLDKFGGTDFDPTTWDDDGGDGCPKRSLVIVVEGGNVKFNANLNLAGALFLTSDYPLGQVSKANGTANFIGTIYADTVNLVGNVDLSLDECFLANTSPALLDITVTSYREDDGAS